MPTRQEELRQLWGNAESNNSGVREAPRDIPIANQRAFTNLLIAQRTQMGKMQHQIADEAGVNQTTISTLERKVSLQMGWWQFIRIMKAYGLTPEYAASLLGLIDEEEIETQVHPRLQSIIRAIEQLDDVWEDYVLRTVEFFLSGLHQHLASKQRKSSSFAETYERIQNMPMQQGHLVNRQLTPEGEDRWTIETAVEDKPAMLPAPNQDRVEATEAISHSRARDLIQEQTRHLLPPKVANDLADHLLVCDRCFSYANHVAQEMRKTSRTPF